MSGDHPAAADSYSQLFGSSIRAARAQLRLAIGDEAFDQLPDHPVAKKQQGVPPARTPTNHRVRIEARQRIALGGYVPGRIAAGFTVGEIAVLAVIAAQHKVHGRCTLTVGEIARRASCGSTTVRNALAWASRCALIRIDRRRIAHDRNLPNVITIVSQVWLAWLRLGPARPRPWGGGGFRSSVTNQIQRQARGFAAKKGGGFRLQNASPGLREGRG